MMRYLKYILIFCCTVKIAGAQTCFISGIVKDSDNHLTVANVNLKMVCGGIPESVTTGPSGKFVFKLAAKTKCKLIATHLAYQPITKEINAGVSDTLHFVIELKQKPSLLDSVTITAAHKPETLVAKPDYSIFDFDFYEDKLLLLTASKNMSKAQVQLSDYNGHIYANYTLPKSAGEAKHFFHDYEGYTEVICKDSIFRLDVMNNELMVVPIPVKDFRRYLAPVADTINNNYYFSDKWDQYPLFNYYYINKADTTGHLLSTITNTALMDLYNFEYYFLPPHLQLEALRAEQNQNIDRHIAAALMSGFTQSMFYESLYAPMFILNDTICVFNHHNDFLYHFSKSNRIIDSVRISYHHPKNWKDWKRRLFADETENKVYAFFSRDGHHYLKRIHHQTGKECGTYQLKHHSAENIKIKDGFIYYVYRPFGSTQERFLYRERIE